MAWTALVVGSLAGLMAASVTALEDSGYCSLCPDHTMCQFREPANRCRSFYSRDLTWAERKSAVHAHNILRNRVAAGEEFRGRYAQPQPSAANMRKLVWDDELAAIARRWASQCVFAQDSCRTSADGSRVAQNIYMQMVAPNAPQPSNVSVAGAVATWYSEVADFDGRTAGQPYAYNGPAWHYTLLTWARTTRVGCGFADFAAQSPGQIPVLARLVVCNYKEAGNELGVPLYAPGPPLSQCEVTSLALPPPAAPPALPAVVQPVVQVGAAPPSEPDPAWDPDSWVSTLDDQDAGRAARGPTRSAAGRAVLKGRLAPAPASGRSSSTDDDADVDGLLYPALCSVTP
ncbi:venom allergen 3-like [Frankliniella occidentalis]|uniref:Venom allergen 3-like n=1 Tax=Frankliniella occidentalis TaxID=133901 RepID=A0A6J1T8Q6_FRAOC|nr:venom allergen 3-like [Frankliniella occidentalis]